MLKPIVLHMYLCLFGICANAMPCHLIGFCPLSHLQQPEDDEDDIENGDSSLIDDDDEPLSIADSCCSEERESAHPQKPRSRAVSARSNAGRQLPQPYRKGVNVKVE